MTESMLNKIQSFFVKFDMYCKQTVTSVLQHSHSVVEIRLQPLQLSSAWLQGPWGQDIYSNHLIWRSPGWQVDPCAWHFHFGLSLPHDVRYLCSSSHHSPQGCCLTIYLLLSILDCWHKLQIASLAKYIQDNVFDFLPIQNKSTVSLGVLSPSGLPLQMYQETVTYLLLTLQSLSIASVFQLLLY